MVEGQALQWKSRVLYLKKPDTFALQVFCTADKSNLPPGAPQLDCANCFQVWAAFRSFFHNALERAAFPCLGQFSFVFR